MAMPVAVRVRRPRLSPRLADGAITAVLAALLLTQLLTHVLQPGQRPSSPLTYLLALAMVLPFLLHRDAPLLASGLVLSALVGYSLAHYGPYPGISVFVLVFAVALHTDRRRSLLVFAAALLSLSVAVWAQPAGITTTSTWISTLLIAAVAGLTGQNLRYRRARWTSLEERARWLESEREERARQAVTQERLRIARELHDVIAHSMSVIAVQSGMGSHVLDTQPEEARRALAAIETTSRAALTEMRRLLGVLRQEGAPRAALTPAPGLVDLPELITQLGDAGLHVRADLPGDLTTLPVPVDVTVYRIVQEALTNALRHGGPDVRLRITVSGEEVCVEVIDNGRKDSATPPAPGAGHGLIGMRERVAVFDGRLTTGPRPGGGFGVRARLPLAPRQ
jgi:signal transduction histidine kinase